MNYQLLFERSGHQAMILIIDYDMGNIGSIYNMLHSIGYDDVMVSNSAEDIKKAERIILPGVGSFDVGMENLEKNNLIGPIVRAANEENKAILGICLGMQILGIDSEEGNRKGLGLIPFHTKRFKLDESYKVPHMGWNEVSIEDNTCPLIKYVDELPPRYYFVHSYHAVCDERYTLMKAEYGYRFAAAVYKDRVYGVQFHPEKSHAYGKAILKGFAQA